MVDVVPGVPDPLPPTLSGGEREGGGGRRQCPTCRFDFFTPSERAIHRTGFPRDIAPPGSAVHEGSSIGSDLGNSFAINSFGSSILSRRHSDAYENESCGATGRRRRIRHAADHSRL